MPEWQDHYKVLQIDCEAELEVIHAAYRKLSQMYHPDKDKSAGATVKMQKFNLAYETLKNPEKRKQYDIEWRKKTGFRPTQEPRPEPEPPPQPEPEPRSRPEPEHDPKQKARPRDAYRARPTPRPSAGMTFESKLGFSVFGFIVLVVIALVVWGAIQFNSWRIGQPPPLSGKISFSSSHRSGINKYQIYTMNANGKKKTKLSDGSFSEFGPVYSPNGTKIAFIRLYSNGSHGIYIMDSDGNNVVFVARASLRPSWFPDNERLAFSSRQLDSRGSYSNVYALFVVDTVRKVKRMIRQEIALRGGPIVSPDGRKWLISPATEEKVLRHVLGS